jgi:formylglycine-generating enzyme required for sulfatase activity
MSTSIKQATVAGAPTLEFQWEGIPFQLVLIPPGEFEMGSPDNEAGHQPNESPVRRVRISRPFYLGRFEVTQAQFKAVMGVNPGLIPGDALAVDQLVYPQALEFCKRASLRLGVNVSLPTEAQWEYACRAGAKTRFSSGDTVADLDRVAWYKENSRGMVHPVGQKAANAWGLYDMHGNVWEFCADFVPSYAKMGEADPRGRMQPETGAMRGGGHSYPAEYCRSATRLLANPQFGGVGMRIAINP